MLTVERRKQIAQWINEHGGISSEELSRRFSVSSMTIWRDLKELEEQGLIQRTRGGAISLAENGEVEPRFRVKQMVHQDEKERIAHFAATELVSDGDIIILEGGTTVAAMVKYLERNNLTVVTNGLDTANAAAPLVPGLILMCCGGILRELSRTFVGPQAEAFFEGLSAKKLFLSGTGFTLAAGLTDPNPLEIQVKQKMVRAAQELILLLDSSKFGVQSLSAIIPAEKINILVTDTNGPVDILTAIQAVGIKVYTV